MKQEEKFIDLSLLGCDSVSGEWFIVIWRIVLPSHARIRQEPRIKQHSVTSQKIWIIRRTCICVMAY